MVYNKEYYKNNKEKFLIWQREYREKKHESVLENRRRYDKENHDHQLELKRLWKKNNSAKYRIQKKKDDHNYWIRKKDKPEFREKEKIRHAKYSKEHPEKALQNHINNLKKLGLSLNMTHFKVGMALKSWSQTIRNNFVSCKICADKATHTHHLLYRQYYPKLALNLNNGIPLCTAHHNEVHGFHLRNGGRP